ncbi:MAG: hydantoinase/oxoprolinase family protein [Acetobacteraceae bacterium]
MSAPAPVTGWDVGGAHLKVAQTGQSGALRLVRQIPCPLWQGMDRLEAALAAAKAALAPSVRHRVTMTGELADLFPDRTEGVIRLAAAMRAAWPAAEFVLYAGAEGFVPAAAAAVAAEAIGSANWHATARFASARLDDFLLADIGSTTTDLLAASDGVPRPRGVRDDQRLACGELVYTGVVRTPVMALGPAIPFAGAQVPLMAELFATTADIHRLTGELPPGADQHPSADGRGKTVAESAARLARMIGRDAVSAPPAAWRELARVLAGRQLRLIEDAAALVLSAHPLPPAAPVLGAGCGRFLARRLATALGRPYRDIGMLFSEDPALAEEAAIAAPAAALALLED